MTVTKDQWIMFCTVLAQTGVKLLKRDGFKVDGICDMASQIITALAISKRFEIETIIIEAAKREEIDRAPQ